MNNRHRLPVSPALLLAVILAALPPAAGAQDCFTYGEGSWPAPHVLPAAIQAATDAVLLDGLVAAVHPDSGLTVIDPLTEAVVLRLPIPGYARIAGDGRVVVLHDFAQEQAQYVRLDDPAQPVIKLLTPYTDGPVTAVRVRGDDLTVVTDLRNVSLYRGASPLQVRNFALLDHVRAPFMAGDLMLVPGQGFFSGLALIECGPDLADLREWLPLGDFDAYDIAVQGSLAYVATRTDGIHVVDFSDPDHLVDLGSFAPAILGARLALRDGVLYTRSTGGRVALFDLTAPAAPTLIAETASSSPFSRVILSVGDAGVLTDIDGQIVLLPLHCTGTSAAIPEAAATLRVSVIPNPFNPTATIGFTLEQAGPVTVTVHDLAGRLVRTLVRDRTLDAGPRTLVWDGRDEAGRAVASGVYLARVLAPEGRREAKMTLVR